jgi:DNA invertase Pin-like site-specific DNA recombinase
LIRERTRAAMKVKRGRGERISRYAPIGWDFGLAGRLVENHKEQKTIAIIKKLRAQGKSLRVIATTLNRRGILPKRGKRWLHSSVLRIVSRTS